MTAELLTMIALWCGTTTNGNAVSSPNEIKPRSTRQVNECRDRLKQCLFKPDGLAENNSPEILKCVDREKL
jgi:hypothetical protein